MLAKLTRKFRQIKIFGFRGFWKKSEIFLNPAKTKWSNIFRQIASSSFLKSCIHSLHSKVCLRNPDWHCYIISCFLQKWIVICEQRILRAFMHENWNSYFSDFSQKVWPAWLISHFFPAYGVVTNVPTVLDVDQSKKIYVVKTYENIDTNQLFFYPLPSSF